MNNANELFMHTKWPLKAQLTVDLDTGKPTGVHIVDNTGLFLMAKLTAGEEAKQLAGLLNWMHDMIQNHESVIREKQDKINELLEYKQKYYELQKRFEAATQPRDISMGSDPGRMTEAARQQDERHLDRILTASAPTVPGKDGADGGPWPAAAG